MSKTVEDAISASGNQIQSEQSTKPKRTSALRAVSKPADSAGSATERLALLRKLAVIRDKIGTVEKKGRNTFHKYDYVREADLTNAVRGLLNEHNLFVIPSCESQTTDGTLTSIMMSYTFVDLDTGSEIIVKYPGQGDDKGDKGVYKALTGSVKYFFMKTFLIASDDDPEGDEKTDQRNYGENASQPNRARNRASDDQSQYQDGAQLTVLARYYGIQDKPKSGGKGTYKAHIFVVDLGGSRENVQMFANRSAPSQKNVLEDIGQDPKIEDSILTGKGVPCELDIKRNKQYWDVEAYRARPQSQQQPQEAAA